MHFLYLVTFATVANIGASQNKVTTSSGPPHIKDSISPERKIYFACHNGHFEMVKRLLETKSNPNQKAPDGNTPLISACMRKKDNAINIIELLLKNGAQINESNNTNETPLMHAAVKARVWTMDTVKYPSDIIRTFKPNLSIIKLLLDQGADKTLKNYENRTAADLARKQGNEEIAKFIKNYAPNSKHMVINTND